MIKTKISLFILLSIAQLGSAQLFSDTEWGLVYFPNSYKKYNSYEFNTPEVIPQKSTIGTGTNIGLQVIKNLNEQWAIKTGLEYSMNTQEFIAFDYHVFFPDRYEYDQYATLKLSYLSLPIQMKYNIPLNKRIGIYTNQGFQVSYLIDYQSTNTYLDSDGELVTNKGSYGGVGTWSGDTAYKYITIGYTGSIGVEYRLNDKFRLFSDLRFDYDFTNADNVESAGPNYFTTAGITTEQEFNNEDRPISHNQRIGFEVGLIYTLD